MAQGVRGFPEQADIVIICMIPVVELRALREELSRISAEKVGYVHTDQKEERYTVSHKNKRKTNIVVTCIGAASNLDSAIITLSMLYRYSPRYIFLYGIAGGMQVKKYDRGGVVIGSDIVFRKISKVVDEERYQFEMPPVETTARGQIMAREFMANIIRGKPQIRPGRGKSPFKVCHEKIFCWDLVLDSEKVRDQLVETVDRQLSVVEMEAAGFFKAIHHYRKYFIEKPFMITKNGSVDGLVIRGISDYAAKKLDSDAEKMPWRDIAADNAAYILMQIIGSITEEDYSSE